MGVCNVIHIFLQSVVPRWDPGMHRNIEQVSHSDPKVIKKKYLLVMAKHELKCAAVSAFRKNDLIVKKPVF